MSRDRLRCGRDGEAEVNNNSNATNPSARTPSDNRSNCSDVFNTNITKTLKFRVKTKQYKITNNEADQQHDHKHHFPK